MRTLQIQHTQFWIDSQNTWDMQIYADLRGFLVFFLVFTNLISGTKNRVTRGLAVHQIWMHFARLYSLWRSNLLQELSKSCVQNMCHYLVKKFFYLYNQCNYSVFCLLSNLCNYSKCTQNLMIKGAFQSWCTMDELGKPQLQFLYIALYIHTLGLIK